MSQWLRWRSERWARWDADGGRREGEGPSAEPSAMVRGAWNPPNPPNPPRVDPLPPSKHTAQDPSEVKEIEGGLSQSHVKV